MKTDTHLQQLSLNNEVNPSVYGIGTFCHENTVYLFFHSSLESPSTFHVAKSTDGFSFETEKRECVLEKGMLESEDVKDITNFSIVPYAKQFVLCYTQQNKKEVVVQKAWSKDLFSWSHEGPMMELDKPGVLVAEYTYQRASVFFGFEQAIFFSTSKDLIHWQGETQVLSPRLDKFDSGPLQIAYVQKTEEGLLVFYHSMVEGSYLLGVALLDKDNAQQLLWRCQEPLWVQPIEWKEKQVSPIGLAIIEGRIIGYWQVSNEGIYAISYGVYGIGDGHLTKDLSLQLKRPEQTPMLSPNSKNTWEAFTTFNPAAFYDEGKVHLLYRAQGYDYVSVLGYATSKDGIHIDERYPNPIFTPTQSFDTYEKNDTKSVSFNFVSGGGYGGCEDPRITRIDDTYYLTYVAFDGYNPPRVALTSISVDNFLHQRWLWKRPVIISPPGVVDKSAVIFPEKVNGKYVVMHRIYPDILIDFVDHLNFDGTYWLKGEHRISPRPNKWDSRKIGAGAPPLKTKYGWLLIYQSVGEQDSGRYKIGAMLLDLHDPTKVLYRSQSPILEPEAAYENEGFKAGVVYPCGAVIISDTLYVYYGGADSYVCVATANLEHFLQELRYSQIARLVKPMIKKIFTYVPFRSK